MKDSSSLQESLYLGLDLHVGWEVEEPGRDVKEQQTGVRS